MTICVFDAYGTLFDVNAAARIAAESRGTVRWRRSGHVWQATGAKSNYSIPGFAPWRTGTAISGK